MSGNFRPIPVKLTHEQVAAIVDQIHGQGFAAGYAKAVANLRAEAQRIWDHGDPGPHGGVVALRWEKAAEFLEAEATKETTDHA